MSNISSDNCPICNRILVPGRSVDKHHLIPKSLKGQDTILIHRICHTKIHSLFTERELLKHYHTVERIVDHPDMIAFIRWVSKKDPEFYVSNKDSKIRKSKR